MELFSAASGRDPSLTESLLQAAVGDAGHPGAWWSYRARLLLDTARLLGQRDPLRAAQMAKAGYEILPADHNADRNFSSLLYLIQSKDRKLSDELFDHAISVLSRQPQRALGAISWMAPYVFPDFRRPPAQASTPQPPHPASVRYLELVHDAVTTESTPDSFVNSVSLSALLPYVERFAPDKRASMEEIIKRAPAGTALPTPPAPTAVESLTAAESVTEPPQRDTALELAVTQALGDRQFEKALTVGRSIIDEVRRTKTIQDIHFRAAEDALRQGDPGASILHAREISRPDLRMAMFCQAIYRLRDKNQPKQVVDLLDEAWHWIQDAPRGSEKAGAMLRLAGEAAEARSPGAFQMMESIVDEINLTQFVPEWSKWQSSDEATPKGDSVQVGVITVAYNFPRSLGMLSRVDFDRAMMPNGLLFVSAATASTGLPFEAEVRMSPTYAMPSFRWPDAISLIDCVGSLELRMLTSSPSWR